MSNYYEQQSISSVERVTLAETIILPKLPSEPLTLHYLEYKGAYKFAFDEYKDMEAKFYINVLTPLIDKNSMSDVSKTSPSTRGHQGAKLRTGGYSSSNYITLTIPKYILLNFKDKVPKGTEFLVASVDGSTSISDMKIIGIYQTVGGVK